MLRGTLAMALAVLLSNPTSAVSDPAFTSVTAAADAPCMQATCGRTRVGLQLQWGFSIGIADGGHDSPWKAVQPEPSCAWLTEAPGPPPAPSHREDATYASNMEYPPEHNGPDCLRLRREWCSCIKYGLSSNKMALIASDCGPDDRPVFRSSATHAPALQAHRDTKEMTATLSTAPPSHLFGCARSTCIEQSLHQPAITWPPARVLSCCCTSFSPWWAFR